MSSVESKVSSLEFKDSLSDSKDSQSDSHFEEKKPSFEPVATKVVPLMIPSRSSTENINERADPPKKADVSGAADFVIDSEIDILLSAVTFELSPPNSTSGDLLIGKLLKSILRGLLKNEQEVQGMAKSPLAGLLKQIELLEDCLLYTSDAADE